MSVIRVSCVLLLASALVSGLPLAATARALDNRGPRLSDALRCTFRVRLIPPDALFDQATTPAQPATGAASVDAARYAYACAR